MSIHLSTFNRQPSIKSSQVAQCTQDENEYDDIDSNTEAITQNCQMVQKRESQEDEMQQIVNYINDFENSINVPDTESKVDDQNTTLIQSIIDDEEPSKLRLSSSSLSSSADSLIDESLKIDRRTYIVNKLYDNLHKSDECLDDGQYEKVIIGKDLDSDYDNDLLINSHEQNVMYVSATKDNHIYENPIQIRESTGFQINDAVENTGHQKQEAVYENLDFDNQLVELKNQIKQLLTESAECEQEIKQQITRTTSADNEIKRRAPVSKSMSNDQIGYRTDDCNQDETELNSVKSKIKLMESIVSSKMQKSERSSSSSSSCSSSRSPPASPLVRVVTLPNEQKETEINEKRKTVKELLSKFEQSGHN